MQMSKIVKYTFALLGFIILFNSCKKEYETIESIDETQIKAYIQKNNLTVVKSTSGYYYQILEQGTGLPLLNKDSVFYDYNLKSLTGTEYYKTPAFSNAGTYVGYADRFAVADNKTISLPPFREVMALLNRGGKARIILPSNLAFGKNGEETRGIPSNEVLVSDISVYTENSQAAIDDRRIKEFIAAKGLTTAIRDVSGVYYVVNQAGTGTDIIDTNSSIVFKYTGRTLNGTVFDSSNDATYTAALTGLILGWGKIVPKFTAGAKLRLLIPSALGYGTSTTTSFAPNSVLDFDIEIVSVTN